MSKSVEIHHLSILAPLAWEFPKHRPALNPPVPPSPCLRWCSPLVQTLLIKRQKTGCYLNYLFTNVLSSPCAALTSVKSLFYLWNLVCSLREKIPYIYLYGLKLFSSLAVAFTLLCVSVSCQKHQWISTESGFIEQQIHRYCHFMAAVCQILPLSWISLAKANTGSLILDLIDRTPHQILHTTQVGYRMATKSKGGRKEGTSAGNRQKGWWLWGEVTPQQEVCGWGSAAALWNLLATGSELSPGTKAGPSPEGHR